METFKVKIISTVSGRKELPLTSPSLPPELSWQKCHIYVCIGFPQPNEAGIGL